MKRRVSEKVLAMLKAGRGGGTVKTSFGVVLTWELEVLAILKGGAKGFRPLKGGGGGGSELRLTHFVATPHPSPYFMTGP